jgi:hypothetical protein
LLALRAGLGFSCGAPSWFYNFCEAFWVGLDFDYLLGEVNFLDLEWFLGQNSNLVSLLEKIKLCDNTI